MASTPPRMFRDKQPPPPGNEMKRIAVMSGALVVLVAVFIMNLPGGAPDVELPQSAVSEPLETRIKVPELDIAALSAMVEDDTKQARTTLEPEARKLLFDHAAKLIDRHFEAMEAPALDEELLSEILDNRDAWRGKPVRMRGYILDFVQRTKDDGDAYFQGSIVLDDGVICHFAADDFESEKIDKGVAVRLDGFFMKVLTEQAGGQWMDGPLIVGRQAVRSYPALYTEPENTRVEGGGTFTESELAHIVNDDILTGVGSLPFEEKWKLMGRAAYLEDGEIDWASVPVLDKETLRQMVADGDPWRGMPIRLPLDGAALMVVTTKRAGENPARIERYSEGWLAEYSWTDSVPAIEFLAPFPIDIDTAEDPTVLANGFFFKNLAYQSSGTGVRLTPILVLTSIEELGRANKGAVPMLMAIVAGGVILFGLVLFFLVQRDRKKTAEFEARRKARKRQKDPAPAAG
ncbi:MAG: hypothetical protein P1V81_12125 [Planctomycetota bacterium]|nr:hypothetical protein [Planctomycetota bacterium]